MSVISFLFSSVLFVAAPPASEATVAEVNGRKITERDLAAYLTLRDLPRELSPAAREKAVQDLIDRELIRQFLRRRKTEADTDRLALAMRAVQKRLESNNENNATAPQTVDETRIRSELALPLAWDRHARRATTEKQIQQYFKEHRRRNDGTRLRVSQIFMKYAPGESAENATATLDRMKRLRTEIVSGKTSFADAARASSEAPSASGGGDLGWIGPKGDLPEAVTDAAFALEEGTVSDIVPSRFGAHLVTVTERRDGDLSLEDVRPMILRELSRNLWNTTVAAERQNAKIQVVERP